MSDRSSLCSRCSSPSCGATVLEGVWRSNPIVVQTLGLCSCLAVTKDLAASLVMGGAIAAVTAISSLLVSLTRNIAPSRIRMINEMVIVATMVTLFDEFLRAFHPLMSGQLGPYVALIVTNCIVMGRAEAFAIHHRPVVSAIDGLANGLGYAVVLAVIGAIREVLSCGTILGQSISPAKWPTNELVSSAPGAFIIMAMAVFAFNAIGRLRRRGADK